MEINTFACTPCLSSNIINRQYTCSMMVSDDASSHLVLSSSSALSVSLSSSSLSLLCHAILLCLLPLWECLVASSLSGVDVTGEDKRSHQKSLCSSTWDWRADRLLGGACLNRSTYLQEKYDIRLPDGLERIWSTLFVHVPSHSPTYLLTCRSIYTTHSINPSLQSSSPSLSRCAFCNSS